MKFVYLADFDQHWSTEGYVADALTALGHDVTRVQASRLDPDRAVVEASALLDGPDRSVLLVCKVAVAYAPFGRDGHNRATAVDVLRRIRERRPGAVVACWMFDLCRREYSQGRYDWARAVSAECDRFFVTDSVLAADLNVKGGRLLRQGYPGPVGDERCSCDGALLMFPCERCGGSGFVPRGRVRPEYECDVAFLGELYGPERRAWVEELRKAFGDRFKILRDRPKSNVVGVHGDDLFDLGRSAKVVVGPPAPHFPGYWSNRLYLTTGYGGLFAAPEVEGMRAEGWIPRVHYWPVKNVADDVACLLDYRDMADDVRRAGQRHCQEHHTVRHRAAELVRELESVR